MNDKSVSFDVEVATVNGPPTTHSYPLPPKESVKMLEEVVGRIVKGLAGSSPLIFLLNPATAYNPKHITWIKFSSSSQQIEETIRGMGFLAEGRG